MSLGVLFPGQGSQSVGMLRELGEHHDVVRATFDEASTVLGYDLWQLCQDGPEEQLAQTSRTQPALLAAGVAVWRAWLGQGGSRPGAMAGHSLGEYTALVCAEAMPFADTIKVVARRGELMQEAVPAGEGSMAAILGLEDADVARVCREAAAGEVVEPVNFNAPGQVVIAGNRTAVERAMEAASAAGARRAVPLAVSAPSHCALMEPAAKRLAEELAQVDIQAPAIPVVHNVDAQTRDKPEQIRDALVRQLHSPVQWVESVRAMSASGITFFVEAGPGKVLTGLGKRIDREIRTVGVYDGESLTQALTLAAELNHA